MTSFNIIGRGFIEMSGGVSLKRTCHQYRFGDIGMGRSVEFSVSNTAHNNDLLGYCEDYVLDGEAMRRRFACQMQFDGCVSDGILEVTSFGNDGYRCVFIMNVGEWLDLIQGVKLQDCATTIDKGVAWTSGPVVIDASQADYTRGIQLLRYNNGMGNQQIGNWQLVPSLNVWTYIDDILTCAGVPNELAYKLRNYWLVAGSMKGGVRETAIFSQSGLTRITTTSQAFTIVHYTGDLGLEWASGTFMGALVGGGVANFNAFKATDNVNVTWLDFPDDIYIIKYSEKLKKCRCLGGVSSATGEGKPMTGVTTQINKGDVIFFADRNGKIDPLEELTDANDFYGWKTTALGLRVDAYVDNTGDLTFGNVWHLQSNTPDMTLYEFIKSVALAASLEVIVDKKGVHVVENQYGDRFHRRTLEDVVSVEEVSRRVECWGNDTRTARVSFDSEDYVTSPLVADHTIDNDQVDKVKETKIAFSEGDEAGGEVVIRDVELDGTNGKFVGKKWTIAKAGSGTRLERVDTYSVEAVNDIAEQSTCVRVKKLAGVDWFMRLEEGDVLIWRGVPFVWTDATYTDGIVTLTLQKVSQVR